MLFLMTTDAFRLGRTLLNVQRHCRQLFRTITDIIQDFHASLKVLEST